MPSPAEQDDHETVTPADDFDDLAALESWYAYHGPYSQTALEDAYADRCGDLAWGVLPAGAATVIEAASRAAAEETAARHAQPGGMFDTPSAVVCRLRDAGWAPGREWVPAAAAPLLERIAYLTAYTRELTDQLGDWVGGVR